MKAMFLGSGVRSVMNSARGSVRWLLAVAAFVALGLSGLAAAPPATPTQPAGAVGPALTVVHQFGDDFRRHRLLELLERDADHCWDEHSGGVGI